jgi:hypothetical protein
LSELEVYSLKDKNDTSTKRNLAVSVNAMSKASISRAPEKGFPFGAFNDFC